LNKGYPLAKSNEQDILRFLRKFKQIATAGRGVDVVPRRKNLESLISLGLTRKNCIEQILSLSVADYCDGPKADTDRPGEIWTFGKLIGDKEVYIKLKIAQVGETMIAKCLSFHAAEHPLCFPFNNDPTKGGDKK
jgi:hypothetical protein